MPEIKEYDLSIIGNLNTKWVKLVGGVVCFAIFSEKIVNGIANVLSVSFNSAYIAFIVAYFVFIFSFSICSILSSTRRIFFDTDIEFYTRSASKRFYVILFVSLLGFSVLYWMEVKNFGQVYRLAIFFLVVTLILGVLALFRNNHRKVLSENVEYFIVLLLSSLLLLLYFNNIRRLGISQEPDSDTKEVFGLFDLRREVQSTLVRSATDFLKKSNGYVDTFDYKILYKKELLPKDSIRRLLFEESGWGADGLEDVFVRMNSIFDRDIFDKDPREAVSLLLDVPFKNIIDSCNEFADSLIRQLESIKKPTQSFDTAVLVKKAIQLGNYVFTARLAAYRTQIFYNKIEERLRDKWARHIYFIQYKGLLFLWILLSCLFTFLYCCRIRIKELRTDIFNSHGRRQGFSYFFYSMANVVYSLVETMIFGGRGAVQVAEHSSGTVSQDKIVQRISSAGNLTKDFIYAVVLFMIPLISFPDEHTIDLDKPFLDFNIGNIVGVSKPTVSPIEEETKEIVTRTTTSNGFWVDIYGWPLDQCPMCGEPCKCGSNVNIYKPSIDMDTVLRAIKLLGRHSIQDDRDRKEFIEQMK